MLLQTHICNFKIWENQDMIGSRDKCTRNEVDRVSIRESTRDPYYSNT